MRSIFTLLLVALSLVMTAQNTFLKSYGYWDQAEAMAVFEEAGGYVVAAGADLNENGYLVLLKVDQAGDSIWTKKFPLNRTSPFISDFIEDNAGNKIVIVQQMGGVNNVFKFDSNWDLVYNGSFNLESPYKIKILNDNNYLVVSRHQSFYTLHKINSATLNEIWVGDTINGEYHNNLGNIIENSEGDIIIKKNNYGYEPLEMSSTIYKITANGDLISEYTFNQFVLGTTEFSGENLVSLTYRDNIFGYNSIITYQPDGTVINSIDISSDSTSFRSFIKVGDETILLGRSLGINTLYHTALGSLKNNEYIWTINHGDPTTSQDRYYPEHMIKTSDNGYLIVGTSELEFNKYTPYLLKTDNQGSIQTVGLEEKYSTTGLRLYPNPASDYIVIEGKNKVYDGSAVKLYTSNGTLLSTSVVISGNRLNVQNLKPGLYFIKVQTGNSVEMLRFIKN